MIYIAGIVETTSRILEILIYFRIRHSFAHLRPVILSADWSTRRLQSWTCSRLPTVADFVKLTHSIVIEIQRQPADLYKVTLCNRRHFSIDCLGSYRYNRFDFRVEKNCWEQAEHRPIWLVVITSRSEFYRPAKFEHHFCRFPRFFFTEAATRLEN